MTKSVEANDSVLDKVLTLFKLSKSFFPRRLGFALYTPEEAQETLKVISDNFENLAPELEHFSVQEIIFMCKKAKLSKVQQRKIRVLEKKKNVTSKLHGSQNEESSCINSDDATEVSFNPEEWTNDPSTDCSY